MKSILVIDIGNSTIVFGYFQDRDLVFSWRAPLQRISQPDALYREIAFTLEERRIEAGRLAGAIISSVVPKGTQVMQSILEKLIGRLPLVVTPDFETDVPIRLYDVRTLGVDRIVDAAAAKHYYGSPVIIFDLGTATTMSVVDADGCFLGGTISAGVQLSLAALHEHTASLPQVDAGPSNMLIGLNTDSCMRSGAVVGCACMIDGMIRHLSGLLKTEDPEVVMTGGLSRFVLPWCSSRIHYEPDLLLKGLQLVYELNA